MKNYSFHTMSGRRIRDKLPHMDVFFPNIFVAPFLGISALESIKWALVDTIALVLGVVIVAFIAQWTRALVNSLFGTSGCLVVNRLTVPGVFLHESAHALGAVLTGAKVTEFSCKPDGNKLGYIRYIPRGSKMRRAVQDVVTGIAPAVMMLILSLVNIVVILPMCFTWWQYLLAGYLLVCTLSHAELSHADIPSTRNVILLVCALFLIFLLVPVDLNALSSNLPMFSELAANVPVMDGFN